jgi:hypothetical protein
MTEANKQAAILECRQAYGTMLAAYEAWLVAKYKYVALDLASVTDEDFDDGLTAAMFTTTSANMDTITTAVTPGIRTNLSTAKI